MKKKIIFISAIMLALSTLGVNAKQMATVFNPTTMHRKAVEVGDKHAFDGGYILEVAQASKIDEGLLGGSVVTNYSKSLSASINSTQSTIPVTSITTKDGHDLTMGDFGSRVFLVIEPGKNKEEIVMCTGISGLTWTGCTRGLAFYGTSTASMADNRKTHQAGSQIIISNTHYVYDENVDKDSDETIAGGKIFTGTIDFQDDVDFDNLPTSTTTAPTLDEHIATKKYVDDSMTAGAPDATESVKGISELATQAEMAAGTATGGTGASLVLKSQYATSTGGNPYISIPVTGSDGKLDDGFIPTEITFASSTITSLTIDSTKYTGTGANLNTLTSASTSDASNLHYHGLDCSIGTGTIAINVTGNQVITHNLGVLPTYFSINAHAATLQGGVYSIANSFGLATSTTFQMSSYSAMTTGTTYASGLNNANIIYLVAGNDNSVEASAALSAITTSTFTINWGTNQNEGGARYYTWTVCK